MYHFSWIRKWIIFDKYSFFYARNVHIIYRAVQLFYSWHVDAWTFTPISLFSARRQKTHMWCPVMISMLISLVLVAYDVIYGVVNRNTSIPLRHESTLSPEGTDFQQSINNGRYNLIIWMFVFASSSSIVSFYLPTSFVFHSCSFTFFYRNVFLTNSSEL